MSNIYKGTLGLIGNTPLVEVTNIEKKLNLEATVLVKLEYFNPAGSVKDRIAKAMIEDAESRGLLKEGFWADLCLFDPKTIADDPTYLDPCRPCSGIARVYVNGVLTAENGVHTGARAGVVIRK